MTWLNWNEKKSALIKALLVSMGCLALSCLLGYLRLEENDDAFISNLYGNVWGTGYQEYAVYVNVVLGLLLKPLYQWRSTVNWYVLGNLILCFLAFTAISRVFIERWKGVGGIILSAAFQLLFCWEHYCMFQYTKNAYLLLTAGFLLLVDAWEQMEAGKKEWKTLIPGGLFVLLGWMLRDSCLMVVAIFAGCWILGGILRTRKWVCQVLTLGVLGCMILGLGALDQWYYEKNPDWAAYQQFNEVRTVCLDYGMPDYQEHKEAYAFIGFSELEKEALEWWVYADPEVYTLENLEFIASMGADVGVSRLKVDWEILKEMYEVLGYNKAYLLAVAVLWILLVLVKKEELRPELQVFPILIAGLYWYLVCNGRVNHRAVYGVWLAAITYLLYGSGELRSLKCLPEKLGGKALEKMPKKAAGVLLAAGMLVILSIPVWTQEVQDKKNHQWDENYRALWEYMQRDKNHLYLVDPITVVKNGMVDYSPLRTPGAGSRSNVYLLGGWQVPMPTTNGVLKNYGITNPFRELAEGNEKVILVDSWFADKKEAYLQRNYDPNVTLECIGQVGGFDLYVAVKAEE